MEQCLFCKIAKGELQAKIIYDSKDIMAFLDIRPANPGHVLVIPKEHFEILPTLPQELNSHLLQVVKIIAQAQIEALEAQGVNILQNNGEAAGQAIPHIHIHIIPRFKDDKVVINWPPTALTQEQFDEIQKRLIEKAKELASGKKSEPQPKQETIEEAPKETKESKKKKLPRVKARLP